MQVQARCCIAIANHSQLSDSVPRGPASNMLSRSFSLPDPEGDGSRMPTACLQLRLGRLSFNECSLAPPQKLNKLSAHVSCISKCAFAYTIIACLGSSEVVPGKFWALYCPAWPVHLELLSGLYHARPGILWLWALEPGTQAGALTAISHDFNNNEPDLSRVCKTSLTLPKSYQCDLAHPTSSMFVSGQGV